MTDTTGYSRLHGTTFDRWVEAHEEIFPVPVTVPTPYLKAQGFYV
jgi:hypothetical protein